MCSHSALGFNLVPLISLALMPPLVSSCFPWMEIVAFGFKLSRCVQMCCPFYSIVGTQVTASSLQFLPLTVNLLAYRPSFQLVGLGLR